MPHQIEPNKRHLQQQWVDRPSATSEWLDVPLVIKGVNDSDNTRLWNEEFETEKLIKKLEAAKAPHEKQGDRETIRMNLYVEVLLASLSPNVFAKVAEAEAMVDAFDAKFPKILTDNP